MPRDAAPEQLTLPVLDPSAAAPRLFSVSVVIPVFNEAGALAAVLDDVRAAMDASGHPYEIVIVDDCSTDGSGDIARARGVTVLRHPVQRGSGAARKTGIRAATGEVVVMLDADGTYPAAEIPAMLGHFPDYDQVIGWRRSERGTYRPLRWLAKFLIRQLAQYLTQTRIPDLNSGLKAFKREPMLRFFHLIPDGFSCVTTMTLAYICNGMLVKYHPIEYFPRIGHSKFHPITDTWRYLATAIRMVLYFSPMRIFAPMAIVVFLAGAARIVIEATHGGVQQAGIVIVVASILILSMGLLGDLIVVQGRR